MKNLSNLMNGKNTLETARILASEFVRLYGVNWGTETEIANRLLPRGKALTWSGLDRNINQFCKALYPSWEQNQDELDFLDKIRFALTSLPMKRDYKLTENKEELASPERVSELFETCSLCWRSVARRPLEKKTPLCHLHDLPSTATEYRKRIRLKPKTQTLLHEFLKSQPPLNLAKADSRVEQNDYLKGLCLNEAGVLPHLAKYLRSLNMSLSTGQEIITALESPIYLEKVTPIIRKAWEFYFEDRGKYFKLNYLKLLIAEAWLRAEAERTHGGKRK